MTRRSGFHLVRAVGWSSSVEGVGIETDRAAVLLQERLDTGALGGVGIVEVELVRESLLAPPSEGIRSRVFGFRGRRGAAWGAPSSQSGF